MLDQPTLQSHPISGEHIETDAKIRWNIVERDQPVASHCHSQGHFTVVIGEVIMRGPWGDIRVCNDWYYVPPGVEHEIIAVIPSRYFCCGPRDF